ncbi:hypothetical protein EHP00_1464 [Ecytonucleospora hepatopenaei]|uniref:Uncharacterized protein n=1 Tax=Ecytonucleospora hepatopenaei TaxID=646526 RepID=A0A1W0E733_9MICR|nr:hypothetical protein EHP00_1464 [Ecytonucleospora hepatopenaei]
MYLNVVEKMISLNYHEIISADTKFIVFLKSCIIRPNEHRKKQVNLNLSIKSCNILMLLGMFCEDIKVFMLRLLESQNDN